MKTKLENLQGQKEKKKITKKEDKCIDECMEVIIDS